MAGHLIYTAVNHGHRDVSTTVVDSVANHAVAGVKAVAFAASLPGPVVCAHCVFAARLSGAILELAHVYRLAEAANAFEPGVAYALIAI